MKIVVCNLGYDPQEIEIRELDQREGTFPQLVKLIKSALGKGRNEIEGYKITSRNYINTGEEIVKVIETEDFDRCICISQGKEIKKKNSGGKREKAGRPSTGRKPRNFYIDDNEYEKLKKYLEELREEK